MSNTRKLIQNDVSIEVAFSLERCQFHPDCCDPEDTACHGCGAPAVKALVLTSDEHGDRRVPFCAAHSGPMAEAVLSVYIRQRGEAN